MTMVRMSEGSGMKSPEFRVTGRMVLVSVIGFFVIVFCVNIGMAVIAVETFSGLQTEKPYENGLAFNKEIEKSLRQDSLGWQVEEHIERGQQNNVDIALTIRDRDAHMVSGLKISTVLKSPADYRKDCPTDLSADDHGVYRARMTCNAGQWDVETVAIQDGVIVYRSINRIILH
jgi:nitrogen fixation protein FixH